MLDGKFTEVNVFRHVCIQLYQVCGCKFFQAMGKGRSVMLNKLLDKVLLVWSQVVHGDQVRDVFRNVVHRHIV